MRAFGSIYRILSITKLNIPRLKHEFLFVIEYYRRLGLNVERKWIMYISPLSIKTTIEKQSENKRTWKFQHVLVPIMNGRCFRPCVYNLGGVFLCDNDVKGRETSAIIYCQAWVRVCNLFIWFSIRASRCCNSFPLGTSCALIKFIWLIKKKVCDARIVFFSTSPLYTLLIYLSFNFHNY